MKKWRSEGVGVERGCEWSEGKKVEERGCGSGSEGEEVEERGCGSGGVRTWEWKREGEEVEE